MSYTTNRQPQGDADKVTNLLREGMIAELVAVSDYDTFIYRTSNKDLKELFYHIMEEEKRHYGMFLDALRKLDKDEAELAKEAKIKVKIYNSDKTKYKGKSEGCMLAFIRDSIKGELEAIILYEDILDSIKDEYIVSVIEDIIKDEKEHVEELTRALMILDKDGYGPIED